MASRNPNNDHGFEDFFLPEEHHPPSKGSNRGRSQSSDLDANIINFNGPNRTSSRAFDSEHSSPEITSPPHQRQRWSDGAQAIELLIPSSYDQSLDHGMACDGPPFFLPDLEQFAETNKLEVQAQLLVDFIDQTTLADSMIHSHGLPILDIGSDFLRQTMFTHNDTTNELDSNCRPEPERRLSNSQAPQISNYSSKMLNQRISSDYYTFDQPEFSTTARDCK
jgi:hypothetical protein